MFDTKISIASRNISILFWVQFFANFSFIQPVLTLFYMEKGLDSAEILWVLMFWSGAVLIGEVPTGVFADRFGAKTSFITGSFMKLLSLVVLLFAHDLWMFFLFSALNGFSVTFFSGADEALVYESLKQEKRENRMDEAMGKIQSGGFISMIFAFLFGAYFAQDLTNEQFFLLILFGLILQAIEFILLFFIKNPPSASSYREPVFSQVKEGLLVIKNAPYLLIMFLNITLVFIPAGAVYGYFDQPLMKNAGLPVAMIGVMYSFAAIVGFFASRSVGWLTKRFNRVLLLYVTGGLAVFGLLLSAMYQESLLVILGAFFVLKVIRAIRYPIYSQLSNDIIPSNVRATTISLLSIVDSVLDLIVFGTLSIVAFKGFSFVLIGCAVIALIGTSLPLTPTKKKLKRINEIKV